MERKENMPLWVFLGLMNIETRKGALILFWCSFGFALFCIPLSYLSERLVVAGHDGSDYPVVLVVIAVGRQARGMELTGTLPDSQACAT